MTHRVRPVSAVRGSNTPWMNTLWLPWRIAAGQTAPDARREAAKTKLMPITMTVKQARPHAGGVPAL